MLEVRVSPHPRRQFVSRRVIEDLSKSRDCRGENFDDAETLPSLLALKVHYGHTVRRQSMIQGVERLIDLYKRAGKDVREVMIYGSFLTDKRDPGDIDVIVHAHEYLDLTPQERAEENEIVRTHKVDLIYSTPPERQYCKYIAFATRLGKKAIRIPVGDIVGAS